MSIKIERTVHRLRCIYEIKPVNLRDGHFGADIYRNGELVAQTHYFAMSFSEKDAIESARRWVEWDSN